MSAPAPTPGDAGPRDHAPRRGLRLLHGAISHTALFAAVPLALIGGMALTGTLSEALWVRVTVPSVALLLLPLALADRLLPKQPGAARKPGLVRDVLAGCYCAAALVVIGLAPGHSAAPLRAEAERLDARGWSEAAWLARWMAGPAHAPAQSPRDRAAPPPTQLALAQPLAPVPAPAPTPALPPLAPDSEHDVEHSDVPPSGAAPSPSPAEEASLEDAATREYSPAELFSNYAPAVVSITIEHHGIRSGGTGFFIDAQGTIATNHHVVEDAGEVKVKTLDGDEFRRVELLVSDAHNDLALLRVDLSELGSPPPHVELGDSEAVRVGEPVSVIGNPLGLEHTLTNGIISARRVYEGQRYVQMSAPISPGNSGGPVFDRHGQVIAVSVATMYGGQNLNLAVPASQLSALITSDYPNRRSFGASSW